MRLTVPVGVPPPGAFGVTTAVNVMVCWKTTWLGVCAGPLAGLLPAWLDMGDVRGWNGGRVEGVRPEGNGWGPTKNLGRMIGALPLTGVWAGNPGIATPLSLNTTVPCGVPTPAIG